MSIFGHNGSAVIGMAGDGCAAIATDLRFGLKFTTVSQDFSKVEQLGPRLFVGFPGLATDTQTVIQFRKNMYELRENRPVGPQTMANMLRNLLYERRFGPYYIEPIVVGLDPVSHEPFISGMDLIGAMVETDDFVVSGTCSEQMYGMCETLWVEKMGPAQLFECISQCMLNALDRDCSSGWGVRVYLIENDKVTVSDLKARMD
ncbi:unnamed protein product [Protopolystoma xenopodis]|uniref:Proteasome subunit beta n=1 Tax=Protopolystoma xenopodis TaxID=117903 RepID=A0A3S5CL08_9PLAT|nr:unnamed protein product [Protopolystoma xenopodis]